MARKTKEELKLLQKKFNTDRMWSWSRVNCYHTSPYEYFLNYVLKKETDRNDCVYGVMGNLAHDTMERFYTKKNKYEDMIVEFEDAWLTAVDIAQLKFDRNNEEKNKKIGDKYYKDLQHFFKNHIPIPRKIITEQFITIKIEDNYFQGYVDAVFKDDNENYYILDFKTSTIYKGAKAINESGQLTLYAIGLHQLGIPYENIKIGWMFLKYVTIECEQANGKIAVREIERSQIGSKLQSNAKMWLKKLGYENELMEYLDLLVQTNDIKCLPEDVQAKYRVKDSIVYLDLTPELIKNLETRLADTIKEIKEKEEYYKKTNDESVFYDTEESVKKQSYYFATLCGYSPNLHKPYGKFLENLESKKSGNDLFGGVGESVSNTSNAGGNKDDDLSWLDEL